MRPSTPDDHLTPNPEQAVVVVVRPARNIREGQIVTFVDDQKNFLGQVNEGQHFVVTLPEGHHRLVGFFRAHATLVDMDLRAGYTYYVRVQMEPGGMYAYVDLEAVKPARPSWIERRDFLATTEWIVQDRPADIGFDELERKITNAERDWTEMTPTEQERQTLRVDDGEVAALYP